MNIHNNFKRVAVVCIAGFLVSLSVYAATFETVFVDPTPEDNAIVGTSNDIAIKASTTGSAIVLDWNRTLIGWWRFNKESGESANLFKDWSSYINNGSCNDYSCPAAVYGRLGYALQFDGIDDYVDMGTRAVSGLKNELTVAGWFNLADNENRWAVAKWKAGDAAQSQFALMPSYGGVVPSRPCFYISNGAATESVCAESQMAPGQWFHLAGTFNKGVLKIYINGKLSNSVSGSFNSLNQNSTMPLVLGQSSTKSGGGAYGGSIDDVQIYSRALPEEEILSGYGEFKGQTEAKLSGLAEGKYIFQGYGQSGGGVVSKTGQRTVTVVACADFCPVGAKRCGNEGVQTCGNYDSDPCFEWSSAAACVPGKVCRNGSCVLPWRILTYGGTNSAEWVEKLGGVSSVRGGCSGTPSACINDFKNIYAKELPFAVAMNRDPKLAQSYALEYSRLSLLNPSMYENGVDDFTDMYMRWIDNNSVNESALLDSVIESTKKLNPNLRFGITLYENELSFPDISDAKLPRSIKNKIDTVYLYIHYRANGINYESYVEKAKSMFPNARIIAGSYAYDRIDAMECSKGGAFCSVQDEMKYFKISLAKQADMLKKGQIDAIEFYPSYFGNEDIWEYWDDPAFCKPTRKAECIKNTKAMRSAAVEILNCYKSGTCGGNCGNGVCDSGETKSNCCQDCGCEGGAVCTGGKCLVNCFPKTCATLGNYKCGSWSDGCGKMINCGACIASNSCIMGKCIAISQNTGENANVGYSSRSEIITRIAEIKKILIQLMEQLRIELAKGLSK